MVHDPREMAGAMLNGQWLIARWEHLGANEDRPTWNGKIVYWCAELGFQVAILEMDRHSLTVLFNADLPSPTQEQIENSIGRIEQDRWMQREMGDKLDVLTGRS